VSITITRTAWTDATLPDGSDGTTINNAEKTTIYNQIDGLFNGTGVFALGGALALGRYTTTTTGTKNDWDIDTDNSGTTVGILRCNNATALTITGVKAPSTERILVIGSVGAGTVTLKHQNASSTTAGDRIITSDANDLVLLAGTGLCYLWYDTTTARWRVIAQSAETASTPFEISTTSTGTQNDFAPGIATSAGKTTILRCNNASLLTITGFASGLAGQRLILESIGAGQVDLSHQDTGSTTAADRLINFATSGKTSLAAGAGTAEYVYDGTTARWRLVNHDQGAYITPSFTAGDFTGSGSLTWTLDSGDRSTMKYYLRGRRLQVQFFLLTTSQGGTAATSLRIANGQWGGFTVPASTNMTGPVIQADNGGTQGSGFVKTDPTTDNAKLYVFKIDGTNWAAAGTNNTTVIGSIEFEVS